MDARLRGWRHPSSCAAPGDEVDIIAPKALALVELKALVTGKWRRSRLKTGTACTRYMPNSDDIRIDALFFVPRRWPEQLANVWQG